MKVNSLALTSQGNKIKEELMRFCSFQANSKTHTRLFFKQRMFPVAMPRDASSAIKKHHTSPLFHEFHPKLHPPESVSVFQAVYRTLAINNLVPQA